MHGHRCAYAATRIIHRDSDSVHPLYELLMVDSDFVAGTLFQLDIQFLCRGKSLWCVTLKLRFHDSGPQQRWPKT